MSNITHVITGKQNTGATTMTPRKNPVHTTETTYMDGVQVVRLEVGIKGDVYQSIGKKSISTPFIAKTKTSIEYWGCIGYAILYNEPHPVLDIDRKISRVRKPVANPTTNTKGK